MSINFLQITIPVSKPSCRFTIHWGFKVHNAKTVFLSRKIGLRTSILISHKDNFSVDYPAVHDFSVSPFLASPVSKFAWALVRLSAKNMLTWSAISSTSSWSFSVSTVPGWSAASLSSKKVWFSFGCWCQLPGRAKGLPCCHHAYFYRRVAKLTSSGRGGAEEKSLGDLWTRCDMEISSKNNGGTSFICLLHNHITLAPVVPGVYYNRPKIRIESRRPCYSYLSYHWL